jgi:hypothetical protein
LKPTNKKRQDDIKYTFDVAKCDKIFDELYKGGYIKLSHTLPPLEELKRRAYCKWHSSYSHATNDCNVFRWQVQSAINEEWLSLKEMQIDQSLFPINKLDLENHVILIRREQVDTTRGKNVVVGNPTKKWRRADAISQGGNGETFWWWRSNYNHHQGYTMGSNERKAEGSISAHDDRKWKPTATD